MEYHNFILNNCNISHVNFELQELIITSYLADMNKYTENSEGIKNSQIYNSIPKELARVNNTFKYSIVDKDAITKLGAKGIVEIDNQLKIIFGKDAKELKRYIDQLI